MFKKSLLPITALVILSFSQGKAQLSNESVKTRFLEYNNLMLKGDIDGALDYTIDEIFNIVPRETMVAATKKVFNMPGLETKLAPPVLTSVYTPFQESGAYYCILEYTSNIKLRLRKEGVDSANHTEDPATTAAMKNKFGQDAVQFDATTGFYSIAAQKRAIAKATDGKTWKFLVAEERQEAMLEKILPTPVMNRLFGTKINAAH